MRAVLVKHIVRHTEMILYITFEDIAFIGTVLVLLAVALQDVNSVPRCVDGVDMDFPRRVVEFQESGREQRYGISLVSDTRQRIT